MCSANAWRSPPPWRPSRGQGAPKTRRRCATRCSSPGRATIRGRRDAGSSPGGRSPRGRRGCGASRSTPPRRFLGVERDEGQQAAVEAAEACAAGHRLAPFAAARAYELARRALAPAAGRAGAGEGELLAVWLADSVLAHKLKWPFVLPLLAGELFSAAGRRAAGDLGDGAETTRILFGYARAAARACDLAAELGRRAEKLHEAAPKLRAKGARAALGALLDDDSLSAATRLPGLSERGARRLFDRLVSLGAIRELTGRATFRLYGL